MTDALFVTVDGGGNLPPALGVAAEIVRRGGTARFLGNRVQANRIETAGFSFRAFERGMDYDGSKPRSALKAIRDLTRLFADRGIAQDAIAAASEQHTDAVIVDTLCYGALAGTVEAGLPVVQLMHCFSGYLARNARGPIGMVSRMRGVGASAAIAAPSLTLVTSRAEFDRDAMAGVRHTGFVWQGRPIAAIPRQTPRILVSFSTVAFPGQREALQHTIEALGALDAEVVVTTGPSIDPDTIRPAANSTIHRFVDHGDLMPETSLVIGHGGLSTTSRALSYGIPVLVIPMHPMMDQPDVGRAVTEIGVGLTIPKTSPIARICTAAERLLTDQRIRSAAAALGRDIRSGDGAAVATDLIEQLADSRSPATG